MKHLYLNGKLSGTVHFSSKRLRGEAYTEGRDPTYYLSKGWPLQAFHHVLARRGMRLTLSDLEQAASRSHQALSSIDVSPRALDVMGLWNHNKTVSPANPSGNVIVLTGETM